jgi:predicted alpha/beta superfamily hydrolase
MALLAPSIMSTTTCLQLDELQKKPTSFHRYIFSSPSISSTTIKEGEKRLISQTAEARQSVLLLKGVREQYTLVNDHTIPAILHPGEILVKV